MRVLVLAPQPFFQQRGTPIAIRALVESLAADGNEIDLLTYHEGEDVEIPPCRLLRTAALPGLRNIRPGFSFKKVVCDMLMFFKAFGLLYRRRYDVVHAVEEAVFMGLVFRTVFRVPYVYDMDSSLPRQLADKYSLPRSVRRMLDACERSAVRRSSGVVAVCRSLEEAARGYDENKLIVRLEDTSLLEDSDEGGETLREALPLTGPVIMYVGNLESYQGIDLLLEAHQLVLHEIQDAELVIIGGIEEDIRKYRARTRELGTDRRTHLIGPRPTAQLGHYLRQADVLCSPRIAGDNTPMKIYSYLDSGRAVVATRLQTHLQVLDDEIAQLVEPDSAAMAKGLRCLLRDRERREQLAYRARQRVEERYSRAAFRRKLADFYAHLGTLLQRSGGVVERVVEVASSEMRDGA